MSTARRCLKYPCVRQRHLLRWSNRPGNESAAGECKYQAMSPRAVLLLAVGMVLALSGAGCGTQGASSNASLLIFGRNKDAITLDPAVAFDGISLTTSRAMFEGLTRYKPGSFDVEPALATSWTVTPDGMRWIFHLRHGVRFQDG